MRKWILSFLVCSLVAGFVVPKDYSPWFDSTWSVTYAENATLAKNQQSPVQVKAVGWTLLGTRTKGASLFGLVGGTEYQKWGYKIILEKNPAVQSGIRIKWFKVRLMSNQGFELDYAYAVSSAYGVGKVLPNDAPLVLTGVSVYQVDSHQGEGNPSSLDWEVRYDSR